MVSTSTNIANLKKLCKRPRILKLACMQVRKRGIYPRAYENFEYLYNEMQKREQRLQQIQQ